MLKTRLQKGMTLKSIASLLKLQKIIFLVFIPLVAGCVAVPGSHITSGNVELNDTYLNKVTTLPITPDLLKQLNGSSTKFDSKTNRDFQGLSDKYTYHVGIGDVLNITVWDHPELTIPAGQFRSAGETGNVVHPDGTIFYPYVGKVMVNGLHVTQIRDLITKDLGRYIEEPQVDVSVAAYRSQRVFVSGSVSQPSAIPITNVPLTLMDALTACGGMTDDADWRSVVLTTEKEHGSVKEEIDLYALLQEGDISQNRILRANDIVHVPRNDALKVFVMGDVIKAETQRIDRSGLTLAEALNNVGGINEGSADASGIFVLRASEDPDKLVNVYQLNAEAGSMLILSTQFQLKPMDIVYVTSAPLARWNRVVSQIIPTVTSIYQLDRVTKE